MMLEEVEVICPYCNEPITVLVDCSAGDQTYIEDCSVCCQPMHISIHVADGELQRVTVADGDAI